VAGFILYEQLKMANWLVIAMVVGGAISLLLIIVTVAYTKFSYIPGAHLANGQGSNRCSFLPYPSSISAKFFFVLTWNVTTAQVGGCAGMTFPLPSGFDRLVPLKGTYSNGADTFAFVLLDGKNKKCVVAFSGTETLDELLDDVEYVQVQPQNLRGANSKCLVHSGFYSVYSQLLDKMRAVIPSDYKLWLCGYSLGAGVATVCALDWVDQKPNVLTFASPRAVNRGAASILNKLNISRIYNTEDIVPDLPPAIMIDPYDWSVFYNYVHVGENKPFTDNTASYLGNHTDAYLQHYGITL
jgi:hypothetical protein